ncbi:MAG: 3-deoxy-D-manno-octulosonic acid transferase, partial [Nitrospirota bacterium]|nr:3-deoxy-D-manno-octulosonic acid transferase [Nitrospirota bacterium]
NLLSFVLSPAVVAILLLKKRCRRGLWQRLGVRLADPAPPGKPVIWLHAVSLGEVTAAVPLVRAIHERYPQVVIMVSTITETGREVVEQRLGDVARHFYFPLDWSWVVRRVVRQLRPAAFIVVETELWPNLLKCLWKHGVPTILVNGRISSRSFGRYLLIRSFMAQILSMLSLCLVQSDRDRERLLELGASSEQVRRTGNMKFDHISLMKDHRLEDTLSARMRMKEEEDWIIAGSTHSEEENILLRGFQELSLIFPHLCLLLAPRHIERADRLEQTVLDLGLKVVRRTLLEKGGEALQGPRVVILDTRGELADVYALATLTFVGGTFVPVGGHNLLEPARWGKPVFFGPHTDHCQEIATRLIEAGGGIQAKNEIELLALLKRGLEDREWREGMGRIARQVVEMNQGVVQQNLELMSGLIDEGLRPVGCEASHGFRARPRILF